MNFIRRYRRIHPVWTAVISFIFIMILVLVGTYAGLSINKHKNPNTLYYDSGLIYNRQKYELISDNWEFVKEPAVYLGKIYNGGKYGIIKGGDLYCFEEDEKVLFVKNIGDKGFLGKYSLYYIKKDSEPDIYNPDVFEKVVFETEDGKKLELSAKESMKQNVETLKEIHSGKRKITENKITADTEYRMYFYLKGNNVRYRAGIVRGNQEENQWIFWDRQYNMYEFPGELMTEVVEN